MIQVFEGPLCCNTGVCGPNPDQALVGTATSAQLRRHRHALPQRDDCHDLGWLRA